MDAAAALSAIRGFREALVGEGVRPAKIILCGSYARGDWKDWSDIDVAVVSEDFAGKGYWDRIDLLVEGICRVRQPIEAVAMTPEEWEKGDSMIAQFAREGEVVYSA